MICGATISSRLVRRDHSASGWRRVRHATESIVLRHRKPFAALVRFAPSFRRVRR